MGLWRVQHLNYLYKEGPYPVIFSPTTSSHTLDLMWPDFSFMPPLGNHELVTPRWDVARKAVLESGRSLPWSRKLDFAAWTGNTQVCTYPNPKAMLMENRTMVQPYFV